MGSHSAGFKETVFVAEVIICDIKARYKRERILFYYSCLVAQMVKNLPGIQATWGRSPGEGNGNPLQCSGLENPRDRGAWQATYSPWGRKESDATGGL